MMLCALFVHVSEVDKLINQNQLRHIVSILIPIYYIFAVKPCAVDFTSLS